MFGYGSVFIVPAKSSEMGWRRMPWIWLGYGGIAVGSTPIYTTVKSCRWSLWFRHLDLHILSSSFFHFFFLKLASIKIVQTPERDVVFCTLRGCVWHGIGTNALRLEILTYGLFFPLFWIVKLLVGAVEDEKYHELLIS